MKKVYIIDDDQNMVESLSMVLKRGGYDVGSQNDVENVVENIATFGSDLVMLDVMFPENDGAGFEVARTIRKSEKTKDIPILMLSAINEKGVYAGTFSNRDRDDSWLPVDEFIEKPINPTALLQKVAAMISR